MTAPFEEESLWMKARLFINRAMDTEQHGSFDEQALWASLSLELLAKAALSRMSPLLIATPTEEGTNLLIASGLIEGDAAFHTVPAKTVFSRCAKVFRPFNFKEAQLIAAGRNEYLHGGAATITALPPSAWWPRFWAQASTLLIAQGKDVEQFVGHDRVDIVQNHLASNRQHVADRVTAMIERAKQRLSLHQAGRMTTRQEAEWAATAQPDGLAHYVEATCPACGAIGTLEGEDVSSYQTQYEEIGEGNGEVWVELTVGSEHFGCPTCHLSLDYELISAAGLDEEFTNIGDPADYLEDDYGND